MAKRFELGQVVMTRGVADMVTEEGWASMKALAEVIGRHQSGDWGEIAEEDRGVNEEALEHGYRLLSSYTVDGKVVWVITEAEVNGVRSATTILFPDEY